MPKKVNLPLELIKQGLFKLVKEENIPIFDFHIYPSKQEGYLWQSDLAMKAGKTLQEKCELAETFASWLNVNAWAHPLVKVHANQGYLYFSKL